MSTDKSRTKIDARILNITDPKVEEFALEAIAEVALYIRTLRPSVNRLQHGTETEIEKLDNEARDEHNRDVAQIKLWLQQDSEFSYLLGTRNKSWPRRERNKFVQEIVRKAAELVFESGPLASLDSRIVRVIFQSTRGTVVHVRFQDLCDPSWYNEVDVTSNKVCSAGLKKAIDVALKGEDSELYKRWESLQRPLLNSTTGAVIEDNQFQGAVKMFMHGPRNDEHFVVAIPL